MDNEKKVVYTTEHPLTNGFTPDNLTLKEWVTVKAMYSDLMNARNKALDLAKYASSETIKSVGQNAAYQCTYVMDKITELIDKQNAADILKSGNYEK